MQKIKLPNIKSIEIIDYSLYEQKPSFKYDFVEGVNLVMGGNGVGKTTFVFLIKYALIGLYKKGADTRRYKKEKRVSRTQYNPSFFENRMSSKYKRNDNARVKISFFIGNIFFEVTRNLYDIRLEEVYIKENNKIYRLEGEVVSQSYYEKQKNKYTRKYKEEHELNKILSKYLQHNYEMKVKEASGLSSFDDLILFVNGILTFDETRKTLLWDVEEQEELASKYFNDPALDKDYTEAKGEQKYYDSLARHISEEMKPLKRLLKEVESDQNNSELILIGKKINNITDELNQLNKVKDKTHKNRKMIESNLKISYSKLTKTNKLIKSLEIKIKEEEKLINKKIWGELHPLYTTFLDNIKMNKKCPMCNKLLEAEMYESIINEESNCFLCGQVFDKEIDENISGRIDSIKKELQNSYTEKQNIETKVYNQELKLKKLDNEYGKVNKAIFDKESILRDLEHKMKQPESDDDDNVKSYYLLKKEIDKLEDIKNQHYEKSKFYSEKIKKIKMKIDKLRVHINKDLSRIFSEYAKSFLELDAYLTYDDLDGEGKRYNPVIDDKERIFEEELSESQRFFVDHSFRMSILSYFYNGPSFYICETPDSSLDISYELHAANVFLKYLEKPNQLILTSNFNNSQFIKYIIKHTTNINYINLLKLGKTTGIHNTNIALKEISENIEEKINERRKK